MFAHQPKRHFLTLLLLLGKGGEADRTDQGQKKKASQRPALSHEVRR